MIWRLALGLGVLMLAGGLAVASPGAERAANSGGVYIALGDSYTSGPLVPMQHGDPIDCGRSDHNYPSLVAEALQPETFIDVSCGSAETKHMTEPQTGLPAGGTNPPQFNALRPDATLVTVGIGGNDAGLVGVAEECAQLGATDPNGTACRDHYAPGGVDSVEAKIEDARPKIDAVLQGIHAGSPKARVAIVGYPNVLPRDGTNCYPTVPLSPDDVKYIDALIIRINEMIAEEAAKNDAEFVDTYDDSIGHDVCKLPPDRWFEGLVPTEPAYPLHPNAKGEASMGKSVIDELTKLPSSGPPARIDHLRVVPRRVHPGGKVAIHFRLRRDATVTLKRKRLPQRRKSPVRTVVRSRACSAGANVIKVRARRLGRRPGGYALIANARAPGVLGGLTASRYRVTSGHR
jgi:lysophospholipase L1-like esterase